MKRNHLTITYPTKDAADLQQTLHNLKATQHLNLSAFCRAIPAGEVGLPQCWVLFGRNMRRRSSGSCINKPDAPNLCHALNAIYRRSIHFISPCVTIVVSF